MLRRIQGLPDSSAIPALHLLLGVAPIEALIHIRALSLFRNIIAAEKSSPPSIFVRELIIRQLAVKDINSNSWAAYIRKVLLKYRLPKPSDIINSTPKKKHWARMVKNAVLEHWHSVLVEQAKEKKSLSLLGLDNCTLSDLHPVWKYISSHLDILKATVKAKLLIQRYPLLTCKTAGQQRSVVCALCKREPETTEHFLLYCPALQKERNNYLPKILNTCREKSIEIGSEELTKIILDTNCYSKDDSAHEIICRNMIFKLHNKRAILLGGDRWYKIK